MRKRTKAALLAGMAAALMMTCPAMAQHSSGGSGVMTIGDLPECSHIDKERLSHELDEYNRYIRPDGKDPDVSMVPSLIKSFILIHPDYYVSLAKFRDLIKSGDIAKPEQKFERFTGELQRSELGKAVQEAIRDEEQKLSGGNMAPDFTVETVEGAKFRLSGLRGKYVLLDFWASWCGPCRAENPNVRENFEHYKDRNFMVVSFSLDLSKKSWQQAIETDHMDWVHVSDLQEWHSDVVKRYMVVSVPRSFLVDPQGRIIARDLRGDDLKKTLEKIFQ